MKHTWNATELNDALQTFEYSILKYPHRRRHVIFMASENLYEAILLMPIITHEALTAKTFCKIYITKRCLCCIS